MKFRLHLNYFIIAVILLFVEIGIALFLNDRFFRGYFGDFLVVILMYCAVKSVTRFSNVHVAIGVLIFAFLIETLQYFHLIDHLGLRQSAFARAVLGSSFAWADIVAYIAGIAVVIIVEKRMQTLS